MILKIVAVRDAAVDAFMTPIFVHHVGAAIRQFGDEVKKPNSAFSGHPGDFELFELGEFDDSTGSATMLPMPRSISRGADFVEV